MLPPSCPIAVAAEGEHIATEVEETGVLECLLRLADGLTVLLLVIVLPNDERRIMGVRPVDERAATRSWLGSWTLASSSMLSSPCGPGSEKRTLLRDFGLADVLVTSTVVSEDCNCCSGFVADVLSVCDSEVEEAEGAFLVHARGVRRRAMQTSMSVSILLFLFPLFQSGCCHQLVYKGSCR